MPKPEQDLSTEPKLEDMLADPIIQLVMKRDGVCRADIEKVMDQTRARLMAANVRSSAAAA